MTNEPPVYWQAEVLRFADHVYSPTIRTVQLYKKGFELAAPVIDLSGEGSLILRWDDLQPNTENLTYTVVHCTADWQPSDLMTGQYLTGALNDYVPAGRQSYNTLQPFIHYGSKCPTTRCGSNGPAITC
ncbi:MAG: DUF5103 domain-containing protein [Flavobacteriales bacterium]|nr:DUF5103 domain-containing protein [Flavobacteriales bacterium]